VAVLPDLAGRRSVCLPARFGCSPSCFIALAAFELWRVAEQ
jgi:hypothetical protein